MMEGADKRAASNRHLTIFSLSPRYLLINDAAEQLKNVDPFTPATAFANIVFPVPGGPKRRTP